MDHANQFTVSEDDVKSAFQRHCLKQPELQDVINLANRIVRNYFHPCGNLGNSALRNSPLS